MTGKLVLACILILNMCVLAASKENPAGTGFPRQQPVRDCSEEVHYSRHGGRGLGLPDPRYKRELLRRVAFPVLPHARPFAVSSLPASAGTWGAFDDSGFFNNLFFFLILENSDFFQGISLVRRRLISVERLLCCFSYFSNCVMVFNCKVYFPADSSDVFAGRSCNTYASCACKSPVPH